ncbi:uncharacterized protein BO96DRAFT_477300 [Aspergillus niger CBS 101883]|uniref:uncharacterized protein n=1 Tax=Aspergillus lacticoffeatus (strain CBS 101883) TaxID=1450533 RepID=UPI000D7F31A5|nr:uncharacterized protein BO96DRAFT_477300 [Aspergillus niger CBS 101883]PYH55425.1 hypothetical protein BO96DRAFT_477300 [Aspergillus niger CBS 101883]
MAQQLYIPKGALAFSNASIATFHANDAVNAKRLLHSVWGPMSDPKHANYTGCMWEVMSPDGTPGLGSVTSLCHAWSAGPTADLSRYVLGIQPVTPGFREWKVAPQTLGLAWARGEYPTPHGNIIVDWSFDCSGHFNIALRAPVGTRDTVVLPSPLNGTLEGQGISETHRFIHVCGFFSNPTHGRIKEMGLLKIHLFQNANSRITSPKLPDYQSSTRVLVYPLASIKIPFLRATMEMRSSTRGPLEFYSKSLRIDGHGTDIFANAKEPKFYWGWDLETLDQEGLRPLIVRIFVNSYLHDPLYGDYPLGEPSLPDSTWSFQPGRRMILQVVYLEHTEPRVGSEHPATLVQAPAIMSIAKVFQRNFIIRHYGTGHPDKSMTTWKVPYESIEFFPEEKEVISRQPYVLLNA